MADWIDREVDVLVVGAGPTGLALACELGRFGVGCLVVDAKGGPSPEHESRALAIHAATMEAFHRLGVADRMRAEGRIGRGLSVRRGAAPLAGLTIAAAADDTRFPFVLILPQGRTERILLGRLEGLGGGVSWGTRLAAFRADLDGATAELRSDDGRTTRVRARWLVGCDGSRSAVRSGLGLTFEGGEYPERILLADAPVRWGLPDDEVAVSLTREGALIAVPLPEGGRWRLIDATGGSDATDPGAVRGRLAALAGPISGLGGEVGEPSWTSSFVIHRRVVDRYRAGRGFVAGDAAHLHSPAGGQGMNTGVQDAANLAWKLALVLRGEAPASVLESYDPERRPVGARVLKQTDRMMRMIAARNPAARAARDAVLRGLGRIEAARRAAAREVAGLSVRYRGSPIVAESRRGSLLATLRGGAVGFNAAEAFRRAPRAGDRMPDVLLAQSDPASGHPLRLSDVAFGRPADGSPPLHALLVFPGDRAGSGTSRDAILAEDPVPRGLRGLVRSILVEPRAPAEGAGAWRGERLPDPSHALHRRFGAEAACLYLVRPDGYIAFRASPPDPARLREHLERLFVG